MVDGILIEKEIKKIQRFKDSTQDELFNLIKVLERAVRNRQKIADKLKNTLLENDLNKKKFH